MMIRLSNLKTCMVFLVLTIIFTTLLSFSAFALTHAELEKRAQAIINQGNAFLDALPAGYSIATSPWGLVAAIPIAILILFILRWHLNKSARYDRETRLGAAEVGTIDEELEKLLHRAMRRFIAIRNRLPAQLRQLDPRFEEDRRIFSTAMKEMFADPYLAPSDVRQAELPMTRRLWRRRRRVKKLLTKKEFCSNTTPALTAEEKKEIAKDAVVCVEAFVQGQNLLRNRLLSKFISDFKELEILDEKLDKNIHSISGFHDFNNRVVFTLDDRKIGGDIDKVDVLIKGINGPDRTFELPPIGQKMRRAIQMIGGGEHRYIYLVHRQGGIIENHFDPNNQHRTGNGVDPTREFCIVNVN